MITNHVLMLLNKTATFFPVLIIVFTFKGFFQALIAKLMGDRTAQDDGFLSLNPLAHVEIVGLVTVLLAYLFLQVLFQEALPTGMLFVLMVAFGARMIYPVSFDDRNFTHYRLGGILTALAGSLGNFVLAFFSIIIMRFLISSHLPKAAITTFFDIIRNLIDIAIIFGLIDLIPVPPFDGGRMLPYILPLKWHGIIAFLEEYSFFIFIILFFVPGINQLFFGTLWFLSMFVKHAMLSIIF